MRGMSRLEIGPAGYLCSVVQITLYKLFTKKPRRRCVINHTKIEWVKNQDSTQGFTFNPIIGCLHGCHYCYAKRITDRFAGQPIKTKFIENCSVKQILTGTEEEVLLEYNPDFTSPTFWCSRLGDPIGIKKPSTVFIGSMSDVFGDWIPDAWIEQILATVKKCPQHTFLFLTKNGSRMCKDGDVIDTKNAWYGQTCTGVPDRPIYDIPNGRHFLSFEPLLGDWIPDLRGLHVDWVIIGSLNCNGNAVHPNKGGTREEWAQAIIDKASRLGIPIFIKDALFELYPGLPKFRELPYLDKEGA